MSSPGERFLPHKRTAKYHAAKYEIFLKMYRQYEDCRRKLAKLYPDP
jgi:hypothetical protein